MTSDKSYGLQPPEEPRRTPSSRISGSPSFNPWDHYDNPPRNAGIESIAFIEREADHLHSQLLKATQGQKSRFMHSEVLARALFRLDPAILAGLRDFLLSHTA